MKYIYDTLVNDSTIPEAKLDLRTGKVDGRQKIKILLSTSVIREGVNLSPESGVDNVVCFFHDATNIVQFVGRCRYNVKNLCVVKGKRLNDRSTARRYFDRADAEFKDFVNDGNTTWFSRIESAIAHQPSQTIFYTCNNEQLRKPHVPISNCSKFLQYIDDNWLEKDIGNKDKRKIEKFALSVGVTTKDGNFCKWRGICKQLRPLGYEITKRRIRVGDELPWVDRIHKRQEDPSDTPQAEVDIDTEADWKPDEDNDQREVTDD